MRYDIGATEKAQKISTAGTKYGTTKEKSIPGFISAQDRLQHCPCTHVAYHLSFVPIT